MIQLEIKNGLSQGQRYSLDSRPLVVGGSDDCDVLLVDPQFTSACFVIEASENKTDAMLTILSESSGQVFIQNTGQPGRSPVTDMSTLTMGAEIEVQGIRMRLIKAKPQVARTPVPQIKEKIVGTQTSDEMLWIKPALVVLTSIAICFWTISAARGSMESQATAVTVSSAKQFQSPEVSGQWVEASDTTSERTSVESGLEHTQYLMQVFRSMRAARELPESIELKRVGSAWVVTGQLPESEINILARMLKRMALEQRLPAPIENHVTSLEAALPFDIVQVTSGQYGNIVTASGHRLYVGDSLAGYQLIAIQDHQLLFEGERRLAISW